ncbi:MAG: hypothetical protein GY696_15185 [Gammaproteobacteria bacterium]|nr:hypothetical protein [Gammaproteobacteria bacterium]
MLQSYATYGSFSSLFLYFRMNDNDLFGEIDSYLDTIDAKSTTGSSDTPFSLLQFSSPPTSSPLNRGGAAPTLPSSSSTPPLHRVGPGPAPILPVKTGFNDGNVVNTAGSTTSASFVGNVIGEGMGSTCSAGNGSPMTSVVQER